MYELKHDAQSHTLHLRLTDFWTEQTMRDFSAEFLPMVDKHARVEPNLVVLSDCRDYPVQSPEVGIAWARLLGPDTSIKAPYAVVVGSVLSKLQAERALKAPNVKVFTSMEAATAWLDARRNGGSAR